MKIEKVGIVGAGTMGRRIAFACVMNGKETRLFDTDRKALKQAGQVVRHLVQERVAAGGLPQETCERAADLLFLSTSLQECLRGVGLAVETVPENVELKRRVFAAIDGAADPETLIGTNTSSIPGSKLADATKRPDRIFNFNFGPPDDLKVEVMGHPGSSPETIDAAMEFVRSIGLIPLLVRREIMGYAGNRIWRAIKKEVLFLLDGGYATAEDIDRGWMLEWETPLGPCGMMDMVGLDVVRDIERVYHEASGDPSDRPPELLEEMVRQGKLGVKSGEGFYRYPDPAYQQPGWLTVSGIEN